VNVSQLQMSTAKTRIAEIDEGDFGSEVLGSKRPVMVLFMAPWSQPCRIIKSVLEEVALACGESAKVVKINADDFPILGARYGIHSIPTLLCFVNGEVRFEIVGTASKKAILSALEPFFHGSLKGPI
jgi:thioredoxin 1